MPIRSEDHVLSLIGECLAVEHESLILSRGDDCAVLRAGGPWAVTCDVFTESVHFRHRYFSAEDVGYKALAVNLSDLAAAGARPAAFVTGLTLTDREDENWIRGFAAGLAVLADGHGAVAAGGDLSRGSVLNVCITAWGEVLPGGDLRRGCARPGDVLFSVGPLGLARAGLSILEKSADPDEVTIARRVWPAACAAHLRPRPLIAQGLALANLAHLHDAAGRFSLMDVSDGLARDLPRLLATARTGLGADVTLPASSLSAEVREWAAQQGEEPAAFAFVGGEDYALMGTCPPELWSETAEVLDAVFMSDGEAGSGVIPPEEYRVRRLGTVQSNGLLKLNGRVCTQRGFDHFA